MTDRDKAVLLCLEHGLEPKLCVDLYLKLAARPNRLGIDPLRLTKLLTTQRSYHEADNELLAQLEPLVAAFVEEHGSAALFEEVYVLPECVTRFTLWRQYLVGGV